MRLKNWCTGKLAKANRKALGLSGAEVAKAIGVTRQQLYNVSNGRSAVTPEMAVRHEGRSAALTCGLGCRTRMISRRCARAKRRSPCAVSGSRFEIS
jgi:transcriptional regulator with XRE-family HTH domain